MHKVRSWRCLYCGTTTSSEGAMLNHSAIAHQYSEPSYEMREIENSAKLAPASHSILGQARESGVLQVCHR